MTTTATMDGRQTMDPRRTQNRTSLARGAAVVAGKTERGRAVLVCVCVCFTTAAAPADDIKIALHHTRLL